MSERKQEGFNSIVEKFQVDGKNIVTEFLTHYASHFATSFASTKVAGNLLSTAVLPEIELPLMAISAFIQEGIEIFTNTVTKQDYYNGEVCLYQNGYWPITPEEEASMMMMGVDDSFEPLASVPRYDVCIVKRRLASGLYEVFDLSQRVNIEVDPKDMRPEKGSEISKYDIVEQLKQKFVDYVKPIIKTPITFQIGDYVYAQAIEGSSDFEGEIVNINEEGGTITVQTFSGYETIARNNWDRLLSDIEKEGLTKGEGNSHFYVHQLCMYTDVMKSAFLRPCVIVQTKPRLMIRRFDEEEAFVVEARQLVKMSGTYKKNLFKRSEYRRFIEMVRKTPFDESIPLVTKDVSQLAYKDPRRRVGTPGFMQEDSIEVEVGPSMETRGYEGKAPVAEMEVGAAVSKHVAGGHIAVAKEKKEESSTTSIVIAVVALGLAIMFFK